MSPKENQQLIVARFDKEGNELVRNDLDTLFSQSRIPMVTQIHHDHHQQILHHVIQLVVQVHQHHNVHHHHFQLDNHQ